MSSGGGSRVTIPTNLRKTIQDIKEIAGNKHSDDDVYAMLKECNMDPNETAQKLLYLDTFHEVKRKRERRKLNLSFQASERYRWPSGVQRRGAGVGRGNHSSTNVSNDTRDGKPLTAQLENGVIDHSARSSNSLIPIQNKAEHKTSPCDLNASNGSANGPPCLPNVSTRHRSSNPVSSDNIMDTSKEAPAAHVNKPGKKPSLPTVDVSQLQNLNPGPTPAPTPAPTPTIIPKVASGASFEGRNSASRSNQLLNSMLPSPASGVYSSASDPVLLPSLNPRNPGAMGAIKRETGNLRTASEFSGTSLPECRLITGEVVANNSQVAARTMNSSSKTSKEIETKEHSDPPRASSLLNLDNITAPAIINQDMWSGQQVNGSSKLMTSQGATVALGTDMQSLHKPSDSVLKQARSQLDTKFERLNLSSHQPVIFPDHIQVPEAYKNGLTFGSLDDIVGHSEEGSKDLKQVDEAVVNNQTIGLEPSLSEQTTYSAANEGTYSGHLQSQAEASENLSHLEVNGLPSAPLKPEQTKPEMMTPVGGSQYSFLYTAPDYSFGLVPPIVGSPVLQVEGAEVGNSSVQSTSGSSQSAAQSVGVGQSSVAISPQLFPFLRQPYPSNYFPYNPYFPHLYMPHNAHQFLGHNGLPQQAPIGNIYMPPPAAACGVKFHVPPVYKPGTISTNLAHFGVPSAYSSYGSTVGYNLNAAMTPGSSSSSEDLTAPELKENIIYPMLKQNEEPQVWTSMPGRDFSALQANFFYNFPLAQQVAFSPAPSGQGSLAGMYHLAQTTAAPSMVQSLPEHSQAMAVAVESVVPPSGAYQQPQSQVGWSTKFLDRENI